MLQINLFSMAKGLGDEAIPGSGARSSPEDDAVSGDSFLAAMEAISPAPRPGKDTELSSEAGPSDDLMDDDASPLTNGPLSEDEVDDLLKVTSAEEGKTPEPESVPSNASSAVVPGAPYGPNATTGDIEIPQSSGEIRPNSKTQGGFPTVAQVHQDTSFADPKGKVTAGAALNTAEPARDAGPLIFDGEAQKQARFPRADPHIASQSSPSDPIQSEHRLAQKSELPLAPQGLDAPRVSGLVSKDAEISPQPAIHAQEPSQPAKTAEIEPARQISATPATHDAAIRPQPTIEQVPMTAITVPNEMQEVFAKPFSESGSIQRPETPRLIAQQIAQPLQLHHAKSGSEVEIRLSPAELGTVRIQLQSSESGMNVQIIAERPETLDLMRRNVELLVQEFRSIGHGATSFSFSRQDQTTGNGNLAGHPPGPSDEDAPTGSDGQSEPGHPLKLIKLNDRIDIRL